MGVWASSLFLATAISTATASGLGGGELVSHTCGGAPKEAGGVARN